MTADKGQKATLELSCVCPAVPRFALVRPTMQIFSFIITFQWNRAEN